MSTWARLADLPLEVDGYALESRSLELSPEFTRVTTTVRLRGSGEDGLGEDVTYEAADHERAWAAGPVLPLAATWTLASFAERVGSLDLFEGHEPAMPAFRDYRRWAYESAALDLALRQAGLPLHEVVGREPQPLTYVVSMRLPEPPTLDRVTRLLELYPGMRLKLDATPAWDEELFTALRATGAVDSIDLKGQYAGTIVDNPPDPGLYRRVVETFPRAWIEDPRLTEETDPILAPHRDRITWDAPIHAIADIEALPFPPRTVNVKPSRFGSLQSLADAYDWLEERSIGAYGGGQTELGVGRGQIQLLAAIFHPDGPNDVAPGAFNEPDLRPGLEPSPLEPRPATTGFRREEG